MLDEGAVINGRYSVLKTLGRGGMGAVYLARTLAHPELPEDLQPGQEVAIKQVLTSHLESNEREQALKAFEEEARLLERLRHPHLVRIYEQLNSGHDRYLVMHYVKGWTLAQVIKLLKTFLPQPRLEGIARQLCHVLNYLHSLTPPVIFRDLKPSNIMVDASGNITLIDFGIARVFEDETRTQTYLRGMGSAGYAPLEQYAGGTNPKSDIYSLGATLYTLVTHLVPPPAAVRVVGSEDIKDIQSINPDLPLAWERAIRKMMRLKPDDRFETVAQVESALFQSGPSSDETTALLTAPKLVIDLQNALVVQRRGLQRPEISFKVYQAAYFECDKSVLPADLVFCLKSQLDDQCGVSLIVGDQVRKAVRLDLGIDSLAAYLVVLNGKLGPPDEVLPILRFHLSHFAIQALDQLSGILPDLNRLEMLVQLSSTLSAPEAIERAALLEMDWRSKLGTADAQHWLRLASRLRAHGLASAEDLTQKALEDWYTQAQKWWDLPAEKCLRHHQESLDSLRTDSKACLAWLERFKGVGRSRFKLDWLKLELRWRQLLSPLEPLGLADCLLAFGSYWASRLEWAEAEPYAQGAMERAEMCLGPNAPELSPYLKLYADVCDHRGMSKKSTEYRTRALLLKHRRV